MIRSQTREIGDAKYTTTTLPARKGVQLAAKLSKLLGPTIARLGGAKSVGSLVDGESSEALASAIDALVARLDEDDVLAVILDVLSTTTRVGVVEEGGKPVSMSLSEAGNFDLVFAGNYGELMSALKFVAEVNLPSFFGSGRIGKVWGGILDKADRLASQSE